MDIKDLVKTNIRALKGEHLTEMDDGVHRDVYRINSSKFDNSYMSYKGRIVKIDKNLEANTSEVQTWQYVKGTKFEKFFCPIRDMSRDKRIIVMDKVDVLDWGSNKGREIADEIKEIIKEDMDLHSQNIKQDHGLDIHAKNIGYHNDYGRYVLIDYPWGAYFDQEIFVRKNEINTIEDFENPDEALELSGEKNENNEEENERNTNNNGNTAFEW